MSFAFFHVDKAICKFWWASICISITFNLPILNIDLHFFSFYSFLSWLTVFIVKTINNVFNIVKVYNIYEVYSNTSSYFRPSYSFTPEMPIHPAPLPIYMPIHGKWVLLVSSFWMYVLQPQQWSSLSVAVFWLSGNRHVISGFDICSLHHWAFLGMFFSWKE